MENNNITSQSKEWERKNSRWIIASFFLFGFAGFFYIGSKAKQKKWIIAGSLYAILFAIVFLLQYINNEIGGKIYIYYSAISMVYYVCSIVHSFLVRKEYLLRLEAIQITGKDSLKEKIQHEYYDPVSSSNNKSTIPVNRGRLDFTPDSNTENSAPEKASHTLFCANCGSSVIAGTFCEKCGTKVALNDTKPTLNNTLLETVNAPVTNSYVSVENVDVNTCSESDFEKLPGISFALAKKLIDYRNSNGGFKDADEFFSVAALKPHFAVQLRDKIVCSNVPFDQNGKKTDRKLDF
jgi:DNA uptake protein ComE-like DNA-binding protein